MSGIDEGSINQFTIYSSAGAPQYIITRGQMKQYIEDFIYFDIDEKDHSTFLKYFDKHLYDIDFHLNRVAYQLQHRLHSILINNKKYAKQYTFTNDNSPENSSNNLTGKFAENLNDEQRMAVKFIAKSDEKVPYLLFGPAGLL